MFIQYSGQFLNRSNIQVPGKFLVLALVIIIYYYYYYYYYLSESFTSQAAAANGLVEQQPQSERLDTGLHLEILGVHVNQTDLTVMQQYAGIKESAVISGRENAKKQELKRILEFNAGAEGTG